MIRYRPSGKSWREVISDFAYLRDDVRDEFVEMISGLRWIRVLDFNNGRDTRTDNEQWIIVQKPVIPWIDNLKKYLDDIWDVDFLVKKLNLINEKAGRIGPKLEDMFYRRIAEIESPYYYESPLIKMNYLTFSELVPLVKSEYKPVEYRDFARFMNVPVFVYYIDYTFHTPDLPVKNYRADMTKIWKLQIPYCFSRMIFKHAYDYDNSQLTCVEDIIVKVYNMVVGKLNAMQECRSVVCRHVARVLIDTIHKDVLPIILGYIL